MWGIHHSAAVWPEPEVFDPRRFDVPARQFPGGHRYAWMPFGAGPRTCLSRDADRNAGDSDRDRCPPPVIRAGNAADFGSPACRHNRAAQRRSIRCGYGSSECCQWGLLVCERRRVGRDTGQVVESGLQWHPSLYAGSARYYAIGRVGYPAVLAKALAKLGLDGSGRAGRRLRSGHLRCCWRRGLRRQQASTRIGTCSRKPQRLAAQARVGNVRVGTAACRGVAGGPGAIPGDQFPPVIPLDVSGSKSLVSRAACSSTAEHVCTFTPPRTGESIAMPPCPIQSRRAQRSGS